jgi:dTDP-4-amino-4,6-dideoxygalactose transaminase
VDAEAEQLVLDVLRSGRIAQGPMVARLEAGFAALCGVDHAIAVTNGTVALVAALQALGIGPGDEVVTSPFTFAATLNAILECGAVARFADIDPRTFTVDPAAVADAITPRTRVLMPVHLYGQAADMARIASLAAERGLALVEDAAQAHGATIGGRAVGSFGLGSFSLYATKNVTSGEGGMLTTDDSLLADSLRVLRNEGMRDRYRYERIGHNYRLTDVQAAIAIPQLVHLTESNERRRINAAQLDRGLAGLFHQYTVRLTRDARLDRDELARRLAENGVETGVYYPRVVHDYECYRSHPGVVITPVPVAARAAREVLSLPVHPRLSATDVDRVVDVIRRALGE